MIPMFSLRLPLLAAALLTVLPVTALHAEEPERQELRALSYYYEQGDQAALEAELRRLRMKYPQWMPPEDLSRLSATAPSKEVDRFYRQVAGGEFEAARTTLAETRATYPEWIPPSEMTALLAVSEGQQNFEDALNTGDARRATELASRTPDLLRCDRVNNAWRLAEIHANEGRNSQAYGLYQSIIGVCGNGPELTATLEKADAVATDSQLTGLFDTAKSRFPADTPRLEALLLRLMAGRGAPKPATALASAPRSQPRSEAAPRPREPAAAPRPASAPARSSGGGGGSREVQRAKDRGDWATCLAASAGSNNAATQYNRGWCAYNLNRPMEAVDSFRRGLAGRLSAGEQRDAQFGIALSYLKMGMTEPAARIAAQVDLTRSQRLDVERQILDQRGVAAYRARNYTQAARYFDALEKISGGISRDLAMLRAWSYLNSGNTGRARSEFMKLHNELATVESARGLEAAAD